MVGYLLIRRSSGEKMPNQGRNGSSGSILNCDPISWHCQSIKRINVANRSKVLKLEKEKCPLHFKHLVAFHLNFTLSLFWDKTCPPWKYPTLPRRSSNVLKFSFNSQERYFSSMNLITLRNKEPLYNIYNIHHLTTCFHGQTWKQNK